MVESKSKKKQTSKLEKLLTKKKVVKPLVKIINYDEAQNLSTSSRLIGAVFMFFFILVGSIALNMCLISSFHLEISLTEIILPAFGMLVLVTIIYFLPSPLIATVASVAVVGITTSLIYYNFTYVFDAIYYTINLCLYRIMLQGYSLGSIVNYNFAVLPNADSADYIRLFMLVILAFTIVLFSFLIYSRRSVLAIVLYSLIIIFPGFFYGFMPKTGYFLTLIAFWLAILSMSIYDKNFIDEFIYNLNSKPEKKMRKFQLKQMELEYKTKIKSLKREIKIIHQSPNREDNIFKLNRLSNELLELDPTSENFLKYNGVKNKKKKKKGDKDRKEKKESREERFLTPMQKQKIKFKEERINAIMLIRDTEEKENEELRQLPFLQRLKVKFARNIDNKVKTCARSGIIGIFSLGLAIISTILSSFIIKDDTPLRVNLNEETIDFLSDTINYAVNGSNSGMYNSYGGGMGGGNLLSNSVEFKNKEVMKVKSRISNTLYLRGWYGNIYTGHKWLEPDSEQKNEYIEKFGSDFNNSQLYTSAYNAMLAFYKQHGVSIYEGMKTDDVYVEHFLTGGRVAFLPYYTSKENFISELKFKQNGDLLPTLTGSLFRYPIYTMGILTPEKMYMSENDYLKFLIFVDFYQNQVIPAFDNLPKLTEEYLKNQFNWNLPVSNELISLLNFSVQNSELIKNEISQYDFAKKYYTALPKDFPTEITELTEEIVQFSKNDYEKAKAVENFLSSNFPYTLNPVKPIDKDLDFVYNFLFDTKEGYCTYYASAMSVMLRTLDIPTRYVEGYLVDCTKKNRINNEITVFDYNAHAWTEVYIRGFGWIPFEPTASLPTEEEVETPFLPTTPERLPGYDSMLITPTEPEEDDDEEELDNSRVFTLEDFIRILPILAIIFFIIIIVIINKIMERNRMKIFRSANTKTAVLKMLEYTLKLFKAKGYAISNGEGFNNFALRLKEKTDFLNNTELGDVMNIFLKSKYSKHKISEEERDEAFEFVKNLQSNIRNQSTFSEKLYYKYISFMI